MKVLENPLIKKFILENNICESDLKPFLAEIKLYLLEPDKYNLIWQSGIKLEYKQVNINPGVYYLDARYFNDNITSKNIDYKHCISKRKLVQDFVTNYGSYYISGNNGIGKTFLSISFANKFYEQFNQKTLYVLWPEFIEKSKRFNNDHTVFIDKVMRSKNLIIDDLGHESITKWSRDDILFPIISYRLERKLRTIVISNYSIEELKLRYLLDGTDSKKVKTIINKLNGFLDEYIIDGENHRKK